MAAKPMVQPPMPALPPTLQPTQPDPDCPRCPRLAAWRAERRIAEPGWHNGPVPAFGPLSARLLVVGLAPGLRGANRTGRPFTGDYAGDLLYPTLIDHGFIDGRFDRRPDDGLVALDCRITNAVRCVPPENKPTPAEANNCRPFLVDEMAAMPRLQVVLALGRIAHDAVLRTLGLRLAAFPFAHGALHAVTPVAVAINNSKAAPSPARPLLVADSFHCSRYNVNTGRLTALMFDQVVGTIRARLAAPGWPRPAGRARLTAPG
ncbi:MULTISPECIES: uracil-DNA glycosylase [Tistrella]|uniref:uracil-DNA glycosylase n=1 Tax=Tistrella TaxID=171436 RepID=UPI0031FB2DA2